MSMRVISWIFGAVLLCTATGRARLLSVGLLMLSVGCSRTAPGSRTPSGLPIPPSQEELIAIWTEHNVLVNVTRDESRPGAPVVALSVSLRQVGSKHQIPTGYGVSVYELAQFSELTSLTLSDLSGDELKALAPLQKLTSLTLSWRPRSDILPGPIVA